MSKKAKADTKYTKGEIVRCGRWNRYTLQALLEEDKMYTISEVEKIAGKGKN